MSAGAVAAAGPFAAAGSTQAAGLPRQSAEGATAGPYPDTNILALVYDLNTGAPVDWKRLIPGVTEQPEQAEAADAPQARTISYGKEAPQCTDSTEACRRSNRRAHLVVR